MTYDDTSSPPSQKGMLKGAPVESVKTTETVQSNESCANDASSCLLYASFGCDDAASAQIGVERLRILYRPPIPVQSLISGKATYRP